MNIAMKENTEQRIADLPEIVAGEERLDSLSAKARYLLIPVAVTLAVLVLLVLLNGWAWTGKLLALAGTQFVFAGKFIIFAGLHKKFHANGFTPLSLALLVIYMDVLVGTIVMINITVFYRLPIVGRKLDNIQRNSAEMVSANPWVRKTTFLALMAFVAFPLTGTGAIGGGFFGRMLGLTRKLTFIGLIAGSAFGAGVMYVGAILFGRQLEALSEHPSIQALLIVGGIGVVAAFILVLSRRVKKGFSKTRAIKRETVQAELMEKAEKSRR
jgi:uncharacterized membrane protein